MLISQTNKIYQQHMNLPVVIQQSQIKSKYPLIRYNFKTLLLYFIINLGADFNESFIFGGKFKSLIEMFCFPSISVRENYYFILTRSINIQRRLKEYESLLSWGKFTKLWQMATVVERPLRKVIDTLADQSVRQACEPSCTMWYKRLQ